MGRPSRCPSTPWSAGHDRAVRARAWRASAGGCSRSPCCRSRTGFPRPRCGPGRGAVRRGWRFSRLVLPDPLPPSTATNSPGWTSRSSPLQSVAGAEPQGRGADVECGGHIAERRLRWRRHWRPSAHDVVLAFREQLGEVDHGHIRILSGLSHALGLGARGLGVVREERDRAESSSSSSSLSAAGGTSSPSSIASVKAAGEASNMPRDSIRYSGTGSVVATSRPAFSGSSSRGVVAHLVDLRLQLHAGLGVLLGVRGVDRGEVGGDQVDPVLHRLEVVPDVLVEGMGVVGVVLERRGSCRSRCPAPHRSPAGRNRRHRADPP